MSQKSLAVLQSFEVGKTLIVSFGIQVCEKSFLTDGPKASRNWSSDLLIESAALAQQFPIQFRMFFEGLSAMCPKVIVDQ